MNNYWSLDVWKVAMDCAVQVYRLTAIFPPEERFALSVQMRKAAVSVASNIAEGQGRLTRAECRHFTGVARGSVYELETQFELTERLGFGSRELREATRATIVRLNQLLTALIRSLERTKRLRRSMV